MDFLAELMGQWEADGATRGSAGPSASEATSPGLTPGTHLAPSATTASEIQEPLRLFESDLEFAEEAFQELLDNQPPGLSKEARLAAPEWEEQIAGFVLQAPLDLRERYRFLPPELLRDGEYTFKLTTDRALVQKALEKSRQRADEWPEYELFWEQHPIAEWLNDRMAAHFRRHEAPVLAVQQGIEPGDVAFVFQGVLSNKRSQPMVAEWFVVRFPGQGGSQHVGGQRVEPGVPIIEELGAVAKAARLSEPLVNPGQGLDVTGPSALRLQAVEAARAHMAQRRSERAQRLMPVLKEGHRRLKEWSKRKLGELDAREASAQAEGKKLRSDIAQRLGERRREVERQLEQRNRWLTETMSTLDRPYLRIAAVLVGTNSGSGRSSGAGAGSGSGSGSGSARSKKARRR